MGARCACHGWEIRFFAKSKCTTCRLLLAVYFWLSLLPFADGSMIMMMVMVMRSGVKYLTGLAGWVAGWLGGWLVPQYDSMLNASDFALLASRCEQFCIICTTAHCRA